MKMVHMCVCTRGVENATAVISWAKVQRGSVGWVSQPS